MRKHQFSNKLSVFHKDSAWEVDKDTFDIEKFRQATQFFLGTHYLKHFVKVNANEVMFKFH